MNMTKKIWLTMFLALLASTLTVSAQNDTLTSAPTPFMVSPETEQMFVKLLPHRDTTFAIKTSQKDRFGKRFSFHFNMLEWAIALPNMGIEFDLNKTKKNNRSILLWGKFNGGTGNNSHPQLHFKMQSARLEYRKYWRTGNVGLDRKVHDYQKINLHRGKRHTRIVYDVEDFDSIPRKEEYYASVEDSIEDAAYNGDPNRSWLYNKYHQIRRNVTSARMLHNPRNWRSYYLGAYASADRYNICINKNGRQGQSVSAGMTLGWSIPILNRKFPSEGGLDLDLGALIGVRAVKYDAYKYDSDSYTFALDKAKSKPSWSISTMPIQELRLAFVYRFRSISRKVSLGLVDDYEENWIKPFESRRDSIKAALDENQKAQRAAEFKRRRDERHANDSISFWDNWHERRLRYARELNSDTVFVNMDDTLARKLLKTKESAVEKGRKRTRKSSKKSKQKDVESQPQSALKQENDEK